MTSSYHGGIFFFIFFFLSPCQGFLSGKFRSDSFFVSLLCSRFPSFGKFSFFFFSFLISIFVGATAQHPQHTDDKRGPERVGFTNIVPEEEKEGTIRGKKEIKKSIERKKKRKKEGEKRQQYQQFHLEFSWFHHKPSIDCFPQLQLNIKPLLSKRREH